MNELDNNQTVATCPQCGSILCSVQQDGGGMLNQDQFDAVKAGDFYCRECPSNGRGHSGKCYWWEREVRRDGQIGLVEFVMPLQLSDREKLLDWPSQARIPAPFIEGAERQAMENHRQSLQRLKERSGLDPVEFVCVMMGIPWNDELVKRPRFVRRFLKAFDM